MSTPPNQGDVKVAQNLKHEIRNKSKIQMFKIQNKRCSEDELTVFLFWSFEFWSFEFVSNFDIRISDLRTLTGSCPQDKPLRVYFPAQDA